MKPRLTWRLLPWPAAQAQIAHDARLTYDTLLLTMFAPSGSTLTRPAFSVGYGYGHRHPPPPRVLVEAYVAEAIEWWWICGLRAIAERRLPKGYGGVLDRVGVLRRAATPPLPPASEGSRSPASPDSQSLNEATRPDSGPKHELDSAYAHKTLHAVLGWRANAQLGVLGLHVERARWVWYSDFRDSAVVRSVLEEEGLSPLQSQSGLPGMLRGDARR